MSETIKIDDTSFDAFSAALAEAPEPTRKLIDLLRADGDRLARRVEELETALTKISAIRDSIIGAQGFNFSEHAYPLVEVLDAAGFKGAGYEISRTNLGTLIEQRDAAIARAEAAERERDDDEVMGLRAQLATVRAERDALHVWRGKALAYRAEADNLLASQPPAMTGPVDALERVLELEAKLQEAEEQARRAWDERNAWMAPAIENEAAWEIAAWLEREFRNDSPAAVKAIAADIRAGLWRQRETP